MPSRQPPDEPQWFVCHTMARCEKKFAALLERESIPHYLPLIRSAKRYPGSGTKHGHIDNQNQSNLLRPGRRIIEHITPDNGDENDANNCKQTGDC